MPLSESTLPKGSFFSHRSYSPWNGHAANKETEPSTKERVDVTDKTSSNKASLRVEPTSSATSVPGDHEFPKESPPRRVSEQSVLQPHTFKHRKPITDYVSLKWERDGTLKDYVHRKDPVNCEQCTLNTHPESEDKNIGDIVLRYSQYQKGDTKLDAPSSSTNGTTNDTTNNQAAALTIPAPRKAYYIYPTSPHA